MYETQCSFWQEKWHVTHVHQGLEQSNNQKQLSLPWIDNLLNIFVD